MTDKHRILDIKKKKKKIVFLPDLNGVKTFIQILSVQGHLFLKGGRNVVSSGNEVVTSQSERENGDCVTATTDRRLRRRD